MSFYFLGKYLSLKIDMAPAFTPMDILGYDGIG